MMHPRMHPGRNLVDMTDSYRSGARRTTRTATGNRADRTPRHPRSGRTYGPGTGNRAPRRKSPHKFVVVALVISMIATLGGIGGWAYLKSLSDGLDRLDAFEGLEDRPEKVVDGSLNLLVLGSDSRNPDSTHGSRADTIMVLHVPADGTAAYIISLPRDLWVEIPATPDGSWGGGMSKLNAALAHGGLPLMVATVENYSGVLIDHVVEIDFDGLIAVVDALGGITMTVEPAAGEDTLVSIHAPYREFTAGEQELGGAEALDYVRQRKQFADGDFARMRHQQELLMSMMDKATSAGILTDAGALTAFLNSAIDAVRVDQDFDLVGTGLQFSNLRSDDLTFLTSPNLGTDFIGNESVVISDTETATSMYEAITNDTLSTWMAEHPDLVKNTE